MGAPDFVPQKPAQRVRAYASPPRRAGSWRAERPGDLDGLQPRGDLLGSPGPDQGYMLRLARHFEGKLELTDGEHERDAIAGCEGVALKRASLFGRAPVLPDLTVAFTIWGYLDPDAPRELVDLRRTLFEDVANPHHYAERRDIVDMVPDEVLRLTPAELATRDWRTRLELDD